MDSEAYPMKSSVKISQKKKASQDMAVICVWVMPLAVFGLIAIGQAAKTGQVQGKLQVVKSRYGLFKLAGYVHKSPG